MNKRTTDQWEDLLDGLEGATLAAGHETFPAFDDDDDQSPVSVPCVRVNGMATWSTIGAPSNLIPVLAASIDSVAEVVRLRREVAAFRDQMIKSAERYKSFYDGGDDTKHLEDADYDRQIARVLTRILEGEA